ncbi:MAG TPA: glycosyltransferase [Solirubrobacterales bacterium]|jgi:glycosyltransferase involved in cell wall biosynthesis|nr:glycosyltransferase [Solirubrobacterales bacterium]
MPRPDVALISPYPPAGRRHAGRSGVASYAGNLAQALSDRGLAVTVVAPTEPDLPAGREADGAVRVERRFDRGPAAVPSAARAALATGAPVVHLQHEFFLYGGIGSMPGLVPGLGMLRASGVGPVVTMHHAVDPAGVDADFVRMHRVRAPRALLRVGLGGVQSTIGSLARRVIVHEGAFRSVVRDAVVVPHGVESVAPEVEPAGVTACSDGDRDGRLTMLCFGFVAPYKGLELALEAASLAPDAVRLIIVGGEHPRLVDSGERYGDSLRERWPGAGEFAGYVPDAELPAWFALSDLALFLYPRPFATSGALALAISHGLPTLLSPGLGDLVGAPAELVAPTEAPALAARLRELAAERAALAPLREQSATITRDRSWGTVAGRHEEIYEEVSRAERSAGRTLRPL